MILDFQQPSAGSPLPLRKLSRMEMCGLNLIMALDNVHFSLLQCRLKCTGGGWRDPVTKPSITPTFRSSDGYSNFPFYIQVRRDEWLTINGRDGLFPQNKERRREAYCTTCAGRGTALSRVALIWEKTLL